MRPQSWFFPRPVGMFTTVSSTLPHPSTSPKPPTRSRWSVTPAWSTLKAWHWASLQPTSSSTWARRRFHSLQDQATGWGGWLATSCTRSGHLNKTYFQLFGKQQLSFIYYLAWGYYSQSQLVSGGHEQLLVLLLRGIKTGFFGRFSSIKTKLTWQNLKFFGEKLEFF